MWQEEEESWCGPGYCAELGASDAQEPFLLDRSSHGSAAIPQGSMSKDERKQNENILVMRPLYEQYLKNLLTFKRTFFAVHKL